MVGRRSLSSTRRLDHDFSFLGRLQG
uniref:Uncharacterized protein n=1 Tax=Arundo donax TaxID=35708 RepID=A0A0A9FUF1_ARUDO